MPNDISPEEKLLKLIRKKPESPQPGQHPHPQAPSQNNPTADAQNAQHGASAGADGQNAPKTRAPAWPSLLGTGPSDESFSDNREHLQAKTGHSRTHLYGDTSHLMSEPHPYGEPGHLNNDPHLEEDTSHEREFFVPYISTKVKVFIILLLLLIWGLILQREGIFGIIKTQMALRAQSNAVSAAPGDKIEFQPRITSPAGPSNTLQEATAAEAGSTSDAEEELSRAAASYPDDMTDIRDVIILVGTIQGANPQAVIEDRRTSKTHFLNIGDAFDGFTLKEISIGKVLLIYNNSELELIL